MILETLAIPRAAFERRTGWAIKPEGLCKGDLCVPFPEREAGPMVDARAVASRLNMPLVHDAAHRLWCLGPEALGRALTTAELPDIALPDLEGRPFRLRALRGRKVLVIAWASW